MHRAPRFCSTPHCPHFAVPGHRGKCADCARAREHARGTAHARGYDRAWATYSHAWLALHRWCGERADFRLHAEHSRCVQRGERVRATVTDHIRALKFGGARLDPANHQSLCGACNSRKNIALEGGFAVVC